MPLAWAASSDTDSYRAHAAVDDSSTKADTEMRAAGIREHMTADAHAACPQLNQLHLLTSAAKKLDSWPRISIDYITRVCAHPILVSKHFSFLELEAK